MIRFWIIPEKSHLFIPVILGLISLLLLTIFPSLVFAQSEEAFTICIPSFAVKGLNQQQVDFLEKQFFLELNKQKKYWVIPRSEVKAVEKVMNEPDEEVRRSNEYYYFIADQLNADMVVAVSIQPGSKGSSTVLAQVMDAFERKSLEVFVLESGGSKSNFITVMSTLAQKISGLDEEDIVVSFLAQLDADIAFCSDRDGDWDIYLLEADERYPIPLTVNFTTDYSPSWSSDGTKLAFSTRRNRNYEIFLLDTLAGKAKALTHNRIADVTPSLARSSDLLVYCSLRGKYYQVILHNLESGEEKQLTKTPGNKFFPNLSPDGHYLLYSSGEPSGLFKMKLEDGSVVRLQEELGPIHGAVFSPSGREIAFETIQNGNYEIYMMNANGSKPSNLTRNKSNDTSPTFSPDGRWLAFSSDREGNNEIYVMSVRGKYLTNITLNPKDDRLPAWSPKSVKRQAK